MKKVMYSGLILLGTALSTLAGCSTDNGKITLRIGFWPTSSDKKDVAMYEEWKEAFEKDNPEYVIEDAPYTYSRDTISSMGNAGRLPTVFQTWFTEPEWLKDQGYIREITDELNELDWADKIDEGMKSNIYFDENYYGIPRDGYGLGLMINKRILGENGLLREAGEDENGDPIYSLYNENGEPMYPQTFEEIKEFAEIIAEYDDCKGMLILSDNKEGGWQFTNMVWNFGGTIEKQNSDGSWTADLTSEAAINALTWIKEMKQEDLLPTGVVQTYSGWKDKLGSQVAMAFVGCDQINLIQTQGGEDIDDFAFVPMPSVNDSVPHYSLYGGTPYVFSSRATDEEVEGVLKYMEYIGRSPETTEISRQGIEKGLQVSKEKAQPILPTLYPFVNEDYVKMMDEIEEEYVDVDMENYNDFFDSIDENKHVEEPYYAQDLYDILDTAIQTVLTDPANANVTELLQKAESDFNSKYLSEVNK